MATQMLLRVKVALAEASTEGGGGGWLVVLRVVGMEVTLWSGARIIRGMIVCVCACVCACLWCVVVLVVVLCTCARDRFWGGQCVFKRARAHTRHDIRYVAHSSLKRSGASLLQKLTKSDTGTIS
jgi:hypothetical protein